MSHEKLDDTSPAEELRSAQDISDVLGLSLQNVQERTGLSENELNQWAPPQVGLLDTAHTSEIDKLGQLAATFLDMVQGDKIWETVHRTPVPLFAGATYSEAISSGMPLGQIIDTLRAAILDPPLYWE
jgi:hypothetical protein